MHPLRLRMLPSKVGFYFWGYQLRDWPLINLSNNICAVILDVGVEISAAYINKSTTVPTADKAVPEGALLHLQQKKEVINPAQF